MDWFEQLTGFAEHSPSQVREHLTSDAGRICSTVNQQCWPHGRLTMPSVDELRTVPQYYSGKTLQVSELVADVQRLHADPANAGALFQVASQFNLLEMVSPNVSPEHGIGRYQNDLTQGPACAIAAGAATIYRNYFVEVNGQQGQTTEQQIDCLAELGEALGNTGNRLWQMKNGYAIASRKGLEEISAYLKNASIEEKEHLKGKLRIGVHFNTQVTLDNCEHRVSQALCSALPVAYSQHPIELWADFAQLILEAAYEATLAAAVYNSSKYGNHTVYLTLLGGGAFGNPEEWILSAIRRALLAYKDAKLDVVIVSFYQSNARVKALVDEVTQTIYPPAPIPTIQEVIQPEKPLSVEQRRDMLNEILLMQNEIELKQQRIRELDNRFSHELYICPVCEQSLESKKYNFFGPDCEEPMLGRLLFYKTYNIKSDEGKVALPVCSTCENKLALVNSSHGYEGSEIIVYQDKDILYRHFMGGWIYVGFV